MKNEKQKMKICMVNREILNQVQDDSMVVEGIRENGEWATCCRGFGVMKNEKRKMKTCMVNREILNQVQDDSMVVEEIRENGGWVTCCRGFGRG